jgi:hypothetical protein
MSEPVYIWRLKKYLPERHGQRCRIFARGRGPGPRNVGVEFEDGFKVVSFRWAVRAASPPPEHRS